MKKVALALVAVLALCGCTTTGQDVGVGTAARALIRASAGGWVRWRPTRPTWTDS